MQLGSLSLRFLKFLSRENYAWGIGVVEMFTGMVRAQYECSTLTVKV